jgi:hypothetical protein
LLRTLLRCGHLTDPDPLFESGDSPVLAVRVPNVQCADEEDGQKHQIAEFHITPPFTSPSGPVHPREVNTHESSAIIPITVKVIAKAKTNG